MVCVTNRLTLQEQQLGEIDRLKRSNAALLERGRRGMAEKPWRWGDGWKVADARGSVYHEGGEKPDIEKYMNMQLFDENGKAIIPIRIDHYEMIYDGKPITPVHRALIAAVPLLLTACKRVAAAPFEPDKWRQEVEAAIKKAESTE